MGQTLIRDPTPAWLKPENASVFDSYWTRIARVLAGVIGADDPNSQVLGMAGAMEVPGAMKSLKAVATGAKEAKPGIRAYHGSPHEFEKFSMEKIGTGEGAQAYGHGLYFAEQEATAKAYRDSLAGHKVLIEGKPWTEASGLTKNQSAALEYMDHFNLTPSDLTDATLGDAYRWSNAQGGSKDFRRFAADWEKLKGRVQQSDPRGRMYEVAIKADPAHFLDWDAPLKAQPQNVKDAANDLFRGRLTTREVGPDLVDVMEKGGGSLGVFPKDKVAEVLANPADYYPYKGRELYRQLESERAVDRGAWKNPSEFASQELAQIHGVPGIKYLDQGSRWTPRNPVSLNGGQTWTVDLPGPRTGEFNTLKEAQAALEAAKQSTKETRNYVVFDDKLIDILRKYGWLPPVAGLTGLSQVGQPRSPESR